jgi:hypothetical protein
MMPPVHPQQSIAINVSIGALAVITEEFAKVAAEGVGVNGARFFVEGGFIGGGIGTGCGLMEVLVGVIDAIFVKVHGGGFKR